MKQAFYAGMSFTNLPLTAFLIFFAIFLIVVARLWIFQKREQFDALSQLPFDEGHRDE